jgi:hypothetical protein
MKINLKSIATVFAVIALALTAYRVAETYVWSNADVKTSLFATQAVQNPILNVAVLDGTTAVQSQFVVAGLDYGDVIRAVITVDDSATNGYWWSSITLDSLRWVDPDLDSLACGTALGSQTIIFWDEITD